jgi:HEAT repeat protein
MITALARISSSVAVALALSWTAAAQPPNIANGRVTTQPAGSPFPQSFKGLVAAQAETGWIGYTVPVVDRERLMCCEGSGRMSGENTSSNGVTIGDGLSWGGCRLESSTGAPAVRTLATNQASAPIQLEGSDRVMVLFRIVERQVERIRLVSADCSLDAGGRAVHWLEGVRPADSVALLESLVVTVDGSNRVLDGAVTAIALHGDPSADTALERLSGDGHSEAVRRKVTFWLGNARGRRGFDALRKIMRDDPSVEVRKSAIFGLSQSSVPETTDTLASIARTDSEPRLRSEALFWLAQKAGRKAGAAITERIEQDPDTEVKKKAVFALSQLPKDEGVPLLINVARTNTNPAVRKQAMFWLGQSKDPRAVDFFAQVLK